MSYAICKIAYGVPLADEGHPKDTIDPQPFLPLSPEPYGAERGWVDWEKASSEWGIRRLYEGHCYIGIDLDEFDTVAIPRLCELTTEASDEVKEKFNQLRQQVETDLPDLAKEIDWDAADIYIFTGYS